MSAKRRPLSLKVQMRVMKRDRFTCTYCGTTGAESELEIDHIIPVSKGGSNKMSNLTTSCRRCNQSKSDGPSPTPIDRKEDHRTVKQSPFVGMFIHTWCDGAMKYQGEIIAVDADLCFVQRFSFLDGGPTDIMILNIKEILDPSLVTLYLTNEDMFRAWLRYDKHRGGHSYNIEEEIRIRRATTQ